MPLDMICPVALVVPSLVTVRSGPPAPLLRTIRPESVPVLSVAFERLHGSPFACGSRRRSTNYTNTPSRGVVLRAFTLMYYFILHHDPPPLIQRRSPLLWQ